jgi:hypothetical protein
MILSPNVEKRGPLSIKGNFSDFRFQISSIVFEIWNLKSLKLPFILRGPQFLKIDYSSFSLSSSSSSFTVFRFLFFTALAQTAPFAVISHV